jgi:hypothetical protein
MNVTYDGWMFSQGAMAKTHGTSINDLSKKVMDVYQQCGFENDAKLSTLDMLRNIESRLEHLLRATDSMPPEHVEAAEKVCIAPVYFL